MTTDSAAGQGAPNPQVVVETPPNNPPNNPPPNPPANPPNFDPAAFMADLDTKFTAFGERLVSGIKEAFPAPANPQTPPNTPPNPPNDPPRKTDNPDTNNPEPKKTPPKDEAPVPGKKTFAQWWFGQ